MLLKCGRPVANCDPWIQRVTQGPTIDGPFGDQWILYVLRKKFRMKSGQTTPQMHWYHIHGLTQDCSISIANASGNTAILQETIGMSVCTCVWIKREYRLPYCDQFFNWFDHFMVSVYYWRTTQNWDGPPNHKSWVVHWATQDFAFSAALWLQSYLYAKLIWRDIDIETKHLGSV